MPTFTTQPDGTIVKSEVLTTDQVQQMVNDHEAAIAGLQASIDSYTLAKQAEITAHQDAIFALMPSLDAAISLAAPVLQVPS